ncbi:hypothetical protein [Devosia sp. Leaf64]|uniref:hypothetical protein n=1 Tax=Devosia sp. Leaf64 TaxID=1736229 RepID=UPI0012E10695|nr:hypothetical protein [Devosia sp. Leaf64]
MTNSITHSTLTLTILNPDVAPNTPGAARSLGGSGVPISASHRALSEMLEHGSAEIEVPVWADIEVLRAQLLCLGINIAAARPIES